MFIVLCEGDVPRTLGVLCAEQRTYRDRLEYGLCLAGCHGPLYNLVSYTYPPSLVYFACGTSEGPGCRTPCPGLLELAERFEMV